MSDVADVLNRAADHIEGYGWTKGTFEDGDGHVCLIGALDKATDIVHVPTWVMFEAAEALRDEIGDTSLIRWNDAEERTEAEVLALLRKVAEDSNVRDTD